MISFCAFLGVIAVVVLAQRFAAIMLDFIFHSLWFIVAGIVNVWPFGDESFERVAFVTSGNSIFQSIGADEVFSRSIARLW